MGIDPVTHRPRTDLNILANLPQWLAAANLGTSLMNINPWENALRLQSDATQLAKLHLLQNLLQVLGCSPSALAPNMEAASLFGAPSFPVDPQAYEFPTSNPQLSGLTGLQPTDLPPSIPCFAPPQEPGFEYEAMDDMKQDNGCAPTRKWNNNDGDELISSLYAIPALVSASPEPSAANQMEKKISSAHETSNPSSTSTTFEAWGELMDDEAGDSYWRDLIE